MKNIDLEIPNIIISNIPGLEKLATSLMKKTLKSKGAASLTELRDLSIEAEVKLVVSAIFAKYPVISKKQEPID